MNPRPDVRIVDVDYAPVESAASLNRRIARDRPLLRATLDVLWDTPDPFSALDRIESALVAFSPSFRRHECRGPAGYHVFVPDRRPPRVPQPFDGRLALAHLIEHAVIDFQSTITHARIISGLTGAHRDPPGRFDLMVECPDQAVGRLCLVLAIRALTGAADARPPGPCEHHVLATARLAYHNPGRVWTSSGVARAFDWPRARAEAALSSLRELGYLTSLEDSMNFSGLPRYVQRGAESVVLDGSKSL
jgi:hypothetical protein